ncbi:hypothetical protein F5Y16DRAFT_136848 [Xylariaceae sp. FL0255]|nr:hypothetical protein F5Y16DRAFT_136848 [Xylariaceae sp. FL0255]
MAGKHPYPYRKGVDITAWVLQLLVCLILIGVSAWALYEWEQVDTEYGSEANEIISISAGVAIGVNSLTIVIDIVEIILISRRDMPPGLYLAFGILKTCLWLAVTIIEGIGRSILGVIFGLIVFVTAAIQLGFGADIVHKKRTGYLNGGNYKRASGGNVEVGYGVPSQYSGGYSGATTAAPYNAQDYMKPQSPPIASPPMHQAPPPAMSQNMAYEAPGSTTYPHGPNSY